MVSALSSRSKSRVFGSFLRSFWLFSRSVFNDAKGNTLFFSEGMYLRNSYVHGYVFKERPINLIAKTNKFERLFYNFSSSIFYNFQAPGVIRSFWGSFFRKANVVV